MKKHYLLICLLCLSTTYLLAQPAATPAPGYSWICTSSDTYNTGAQSTTPGVPDDTSYGVNGNPPDVGCPYVHDQLFGNIGDDRNDGCGGTNIDENFPINSTEIRTVTLSDWNNTNPESGVAAGATSGTVCLQTSAILHILPSVNPGDPGTGAGGDEMRLEIIGGNSGAQSDFNITATYDLTWADNRFNTSGGSGVQTVNQPSLTANDAGSGNNYEWTTTTDNNTWLFTPATQIGIGNTYGQDFMVTSLEDGGSFQVNFTSSASVAISRNFGNADARAQFGPGMQGLTSLEVSYKCWEIQQDAVLPIQLTSFEAKKQNNKIALNWESAYEEDFDYFEIEKSQDSKTWTVVDKIAGTNQSTAKNEYHFLDSNPLKGMNYYRLKMVDQNASFHYSETKSVEFITNGHVSIFPNPIKDQLNATIELDNDQDIKIQIFNINGQLINSFSQNLSRGIQTISIDCTPLNQGMYFLNIRDDNATINIKERFLKK